MTSKTRLTYSIILIVVLSASIVLRKTLEGEIMFAVGILSLPVFGFLQAYKDYKLDKTATVPKRLFIFSIILLITSCTGITYIVLN